MAGHSRVNRFGPDYKSEERLHAQLQCDTGGNDEGQSSDARQVFGAALHLQRYGEGAAASTRGDDDGPVRRRDEGESGPGDRHRVQSSGLSRGTVAGSIERGVEYIYIGD